jgi:isoleucyl-tRNA synthetase
MPYAQWHWPFENDAEFRRHFPAEFICEAIDQTRGWFYTLMAISTMLGMGPSYRNVIVNDMILDAEGRKMSKSKGNVVDPWEAIGEFGSDPLRWYLLLVSNPWVPKRYDPESVRESTRKFFDTVGNTYRFFALYGNVEAWAPAASDPAPAERSVQRARPLASLPPAPDHRGGGTRARRLSADARLPDRSRLRERRPVELVRAAEPAALLGEHR